MRPGVSTTSSTPSRAGLRLLTMALVLMVSAGSAFASRTLRDETGRQVTVPDSVRRVVSLAPSVTDTIYQLGGGAQLVGISDYTYFPPQAAREKPSVGGMNPSIEKIASLRPDVVIAIVTQSGADTVRALERLRIPVFLVNTKGLASIYTSVRSIGMVLGRDQQASALIDKLHAKERNVRAAAGAQKSPSVMLVLWLDPCMTAGHDAFMTELIEAAGARSVSDDLPQEWARVSIETVVARNPKYLLLTRDSAFGLKEMQQRPGWSSLAAVRNGRVVRIDQRLQLPSPSALDGLEALAQQVQQMRAQQ